MRRKELRIIVAGGRDFEDYLTLRKVMIDYLTNYIGEIVIISGTAKGADQLGEQFAKEHGCIIRRFPADWDKYGRAAGYIRNKEMAKYAAEENGVLFAFWDGRSKGTKHMIDLAEEYGLEVHIVRY